jgi:uncharacterized membrane protein
MNEMEEPTKQAFPGGRRRSDFLILSTILVASSIGCGAVLVARWILTGRFAHRYLVWNLILAWIPYLIALLLLPVRKIERRGVKRVLVSGIGLLWLMFYPNSPYIFTDMIHVVNGTFAHTGARDWLSPNSLLWYDLIQNSTFAFTGHFIGLISLAIVHDSVRQTWNRATGWVVCLIAICLAGAGIYVGRFMRLNSWDILVTPFESLSRISSSIFTPHALLFSMAFSFFIAATYLMLYFFRRVGFPGSDE